MTFDLEKVREANHDYLDLQYQLDSAEAEIERLRAALVEHEEHENQTHMVLGNILGTDDTLENVAKRAAVRIKEFEDALVEERAKQFDVDEPCPARTHQEYCDILKGLCDGFPHMWKQCPRKPEKLDAARQQLQAEGKIGPDADAKPHCWQITEERKAAIDRGMRFLAWSNAKTNDPGTEIDLAVLRAMLTEADDCKDFEEIPND